MKSFTLPSTNVNNTASKSLCTQDSLVVKVPQIIAAIVGNLLAFTFGTVTGWASPSLPHLQSEEDPQLGGRPITSEEASLFGSLAFIGAFFGSPVFGYVAQQFGRKAAGYLCAMLFVPSWLVIATTDSVGFYYVARFISGFCCSGVIIFGSMYTTEISQDSIRGFLGTFRTVFSSSAIVFIFGVGPYMSVRNMAYVCLSLPVAYMFMLYWLPESPMYLLSRGRTEDAMAAMLWLRGNNRILAEEDLAKISAVVSNKSDTVSSLTLMRSIFSSRGTRRALLICVTLGICQQLTGIAPILSYLQDIFELSGSSLTPTAATVVVAFMMFLGMILSLIFLDLAGRRLLLILSEIIVALCLGILGLYFHLLQHGTDVRFLGILPVVCVSVWLFSVSSGLGSVTYVLMSEMFDANARGTAAFATTGAMWLTAFLTTQFYMDLERCITTAGVFWCFAACSIACALFVYIEMPETKNRDVESILKELNRQSKSKSKDQKVWSTSLDSQSY